MLQGYSVNACVVLSQAEESKSEDGLLEAGEIMKLDLKADLTVLSGCETARGKVGVGEGVMGLNWAIFVAGQDSCSSERGLEKVSRAL